MSELERRLRDAAQSESAAYQPSADLPGRIDHRVRLRRRRTQALAAGGALAAAAIFALVVTQLPGDDQQGVVADDSSSTTTTSTTTTTVSTTSTSTTTTTTTPPPPVLDEGTPLNPKGVGPIEAGMTVAQAEAASGLTLTAQDVDMFGGYCFYVELEGHPDLSIRVSSPGSDPVSDPRDAVISAISIYDLDPAGPSSRLTTAGVGLGATEAEVHAAHTGAIDEQPHVYVPEGAYLYAFSPDTPGFGIRYVLDEHRVVTSIDVGDAGGITAPEGCA